MTNKTSFSGRNIEIAVAAAAKAHGVSPDALNYEVLAGQGGGFALIKVKSGAADSSSSLVEKISDTPREPAPERSESRQRDRGERRGRDRDRGDRGGRGDRRGRDRDRGGRGDRRGRDRDRGGRGDRRSPRAPAPLPVMPADGPTEVVGRLAEGTELTEVGQRCFDAMTELLTGLGFGMNFVVTEDNERVHFDLESEVYHPVLIGRDMGVLDALEHLVDKMANDNAEDRRRISVDSQGIKAGQDTELSQSARDLADLAIERGKTMKMGPLDPRSRRVVHVTLKEHGGVSTRSEGDGAFRQVCIIPHRDKSED